MPGAMATEYSSAAEGFGYRRGCKPPSGLAGFIILLPKVAKCFEPETGPKRCRQTIYHRTWAEQLPATPPSNQPTPPGPPTHRPNQPHPPPHHPPPPFRAFWTASASAAGSAVGSSAAGAAGVDPEGTRTCDVRFLRVVLEGPPPFLAGAQQG